MDNLRLWMPMVTMGLNLVKVLLKMIYYTQEADGFVYIRINNTTDVVKFTQASTTSTLAIDYIYFADNSRIRANAILVSLKTLTEGDDTLTANRNGTNNIQALAGDDTITGGIDARNN
ncbi:hypothetical protein BSPWISOXPB_6381 [uncultured Gammaproteobacteria bacterium]|nr:hypothetical protein BSPWISOXPB_6381 [uncultured Gammaproteobacteria bacterium]